VLPNLLATRRGRLTAFSLLYLTEGIPLGFVATAVATQLRRQGVGPAEIGGFVGSFYLPWAFKWAAGPLVDLLHVEKLGRRRGWILMAQSMMVITLLSTIGAHLPADLKLFTILLLIHNSFAATQDVAIDALAVGSLAESERGMANGLMFGSAYLGQTIGGSAVLFLMKYLGIVGSTVFVAATIASVTLFVVVPMREAPAPPNSSPASSGLGAALREILKFLEEAVRALFFNLSGFLGLLFAVLPAGAMALGLALQSNLAVELGMNDDGVAMINLVSAVISAVCCVLGGLISDRLGRRRMLAVYIALMSVPTVLLARALSAEHWILPVDMNDPARRTASTGLLSVFWIATLVYNGFNGLMYGTRTALFMDVTDPKVAATQFTAYMALMNVCIAYSARWQGFWAEHHGYPNTLLIDAGIGLVSLILLPFLRPRPRKTPTA